MKARALLLLLLVLSLLTFSGCGERGVDNAKTKLLHGSITEKRLGSPHDTQLEEEGVLIHPGPGPTEVCFAPGSKLGAVTLVGRIKALPKEADAIKGAGSVGVTFVQDGAAGPRQVVDRSKSLEQAVDFSKVRELKVIVDNGNSASQFDWFYLGVK
jgi:hypothetical protein